MKGDISYQGFKDLALRFGVECEFVEADDFQTVFELVDRGETDAGIISRLYGLENESRYRVKKSPILCCPSELRFAAPKGKHQALLQAIDSHMARLKADRKSVYHQSLARWLEHLPAHKPPRWLMPVVISVGGLLLLLAILNIILHGKVKQTAFALAHKAKALTAESSRRRQAESSLDQTGRALAASRSCNRALVRAENETQLLWEICRHIVEVGGYRLAWIGFAQDDADKTIKPVAHAGAEDGYLDTLRLTWADTERGRGPGGTAIRTGKPVAARDILTDPAFSPWREEARKRGYASALALPVTANGRTAGVLAIYSEEPDAFTPDETELLDEFAQDLSYGISSLRLRRRHEELEKQLEKRLSYEHLVAHISSLAVTIGDLATLQTVCLRVLGRTLDVSRVYIFEHDHEADTMDNTYEWAARGVSPQKDNLQNIPSETVPWWMDMVSNNRVINFSDIGDIPGETEREILQEQDIKSILVVPLFISGAYYGFMGFDECRRRRDWPREDVDLIFSISQILARAIERKKAEQEIMASREQVHQLQKMDAIGKLAGGVAHDFNNLLTAIIGYNDIIISGLENDDPAYQDALEIRKAAEQAAGLTSQLLAFSRRTVLQPKILDINAGIRKSRKMLQRLIGEDITLRTDLAPDLHRTKADPSNIDQIIMNLAVNARDAMPDGGTLTVKTENVNLDGRDCQTIPEAVPGRFVRLIVEDTGAGMDRETVDRIFEPFFTTKAAGKGTGLGLSVVYGILKQHGGWVNVYSEPGIGSSFKIYLPVFSIDSETPADESEPAAGKQSRGRRQRILVVEDEEQVRAFAVRVLRKNNYTVFEAGSAAEARDIFDQENGRFDLVFSDVVLPDRTGIQLVEELQELNPGVKIILTSGYTDERSKFPLIQTRDIKFIHKPYTIAGLLRAVEERL